jgi:urease accessory protein
MKSFALPIRRVFLSLLAVVLPTAAFAHPGHDGDHGGGLTWDFSAGFAHPLGGLDHVLAMVAVGIWAAQLGGRARWALPLAFIGAMTVGAAAGAGGFGVAWVEQAIAASVFLIGLLVVCAARLPLVVGVLLTASFAVFHGLAHGAEMPAGATGAAYGAGFAAATALLHAAGLGLGTLAARAPKWVMQAAGAALALAGGWMLTA